MSSFDTDVMEDLFYEEAEGPARHFEEFEEDAFEEEMFEDGFEEYDALEEGEAYEEDVMDAMEEAVVDALEAEDTDEFFRRLRRGLGRLARGAVRVARRVAPVVGRIARTVAPIASAIPLPWTQAIGRVAGVVGRLMADEADEFEALDEMLEFGEYDDIDAAAPIIAGLTIRRTMPGVSRMPRAQRRQLVRSVTQATRAVARRAGPQAARAVPRVAQAAVRTARRRGIPARAIPQAIARATTQVARSPQLARRVARTAAPAAGRAMAGPISRRRQRYTLRGPVTISIQGR
jgi:hypothetical protein